MKGGGGGMDSFEGLCKNHELNHLSSVIILFVLAYVCVWKWQ